MKLFNFLILSIILIISACLGPIDNTPPYEPCSEENYTPFYEQFDSNSIHLTVRCTCQDSMVDLVTRIAPYNLLESLSFYCNESQFNTIPLQPLVKRLRSNVITSNITAFPNLETFSDFYNIDNKSSIETPLVSELTLLPNLKKIDIHNLFQFPDEIGTIPLEEFKLVYLGYTGRDAVPANLHKLVNLTDLELNWYGDIPFPMPDNYGDLVNLEYLFLSGLETNIPASFNQMEKLKLMKFSNLDLLSEIPNIFENMDSLVDVDIYGTYMSLNSQKSLYKTPNLKNLIFKYCQINEIASEIGDLENLEELRILSYPYRETVSALPQSIGNLSNLKYLELYEVHFTQFPNGVIGLKNNLESLKISNASLVAIPSEIGDFTNLRELTLFDCQITNLPSEIQNLADTLESLDLRENNIDEATKQQIKDWLPNTIVYF